MICSKCGNSIPNGDAFCPKCGHKITSLEINYDVGRVRISLLEQARTGAFFSLVAVMMIFVALMVLSWFSTPDVSKYAEALETLGAKQSIVDIFDIGKLEGALSILYIAASFLLSLPSFLTAFGLLMFMIYAYGKIKITGLSIVKSALNVNIVYFSVLSLGIFGGGVALVIFEAYGDPHSLVWSLPMFLLAAGVTAAALILINKLNAIVRIVREAIENDDFSESPSAYAVYASAAMGIVGALLSVVIFCFVRDYITALIFLSWSISQILTAVSIEKIRRVDGEIYGGVFETVRKTPSSGGVTVSKCALCGRLLYGGQRCNCRRKTNNKYFKKSTNL